VIGRSWAFLGAGGALAALSSARPERSLRDGSSPWGCPGCFRAYCDQSQLYQPFWDWLWLGLEACWGRRCALRPPPEPHLFQPAEPLSCSDSSSNSDGLIRAGAAWRRLPARRRWRVADARHQPTAQGMDPWAGIGGAGVRAAPCGERAMGCAQLGWVQRITMPPSTCSTWPVM